MPMNLTGVKWKDTDFESRWPDASFKDKGGEGCIIHEKGYADLYRYDNPNTKESLFELQFNNVYPDCNYWEFDCGSRASGGPAYR